MLILYYNTIAEHNIVQYGHCGHCFNHRYSTRQNARIVSSARTECYVVAVLVYGRLLLKNGCYRLESHSEVDIFAVAYSSLNASAVVGCCVYFAVVGCEDIVLLASS